MPLRNPAPSPVVTTLANDRPTVGEYVPDREAWLTGAVTTLASGLLTLTFWTADKTEPINNVKVTTGATAAAATPTLCRMGIYSANAAGDITLLAACANDTTLFSAASTSYTRALTTQFDKVAGQRYATALLVVTAAALPIFVGSAAPSATGQYAHMFDMPAKCSRVTAQTDLAASYTRAQQTAWPYRVGFTLT